MDLTKIMEQVAAKNGVSPAEVRRELGAVLGVADDSQLAEVLQELALKAALGEKNKALTFGADLCYNIK